MNERTIILKATRVTTMWISDEKRLVVAAFIPGANSINEFRTAETLSQRFRVDINDETGEFTTGMLWRIETLQVSDDRRALNLLLVKA